MSDASNLIVAWNRYWFTARSLMDLAVMRIVAVGLELVLLLASWPVGGEFRRLHQNLSIYRPLSAVRLLTLSYRHNWIPPVWALHAIFWIAVATGILGFIGFCTNRSLIIFGISCIFIHGFRYSFGHFHHPDALMIFALTVLALSPCGRVLSIDALRAGRGAFFDLEKQSPFASWPMRFIQWMFVLIYASAAFYKLRHGFGWINGYTLQWYLVHDALAWDRPAGMWLARQHELTLVLSWAAVLFESTFFLVMIFPKLRWVYLPFGLGFHAGIYVLMAAPFFEFMALYSVFVPWGKVFSRIREKWGTGVRLADASPGLRADLYDRKRPA